MGYRLEDRSSISGRKKIFHSVQIGSGAHPLSYPMGTKGYFPGGKEAGA
jgi:hypothetical protein